VRDCLKKCELPSGPRGPFPHHWFYSLPGAPQPPAPPAYGEN
jgi:hypothetical protein